MTTTGSDTYSNSTNSATPCSLSTALTALSSGGTAVAGDRIWIKSGAYTQRSGTDTLTIDGTIASPIVIQGYNGSINDLDAPTYNADGSLVTTNYPIIDYAQTFRMNASGSDYIIWRNIKFTSAGTGVSAAVLTTGTNCVVHQCYMTNPSTNAAAVALTPGANGVVENCDMALTGASGGGAALSSSGAQLRVIGNRILDSQIMGLSIAATGAVILDNVFFAAVVGPPIAINGSTTTWVWTIRGNTTQGKTAGIQTGAGTFTTLNYFGDNHITDCTDAILSLQDGTSQLCAWFSHNRFRDNTRDVNGWDDWKSGGTAGEVTTDTGTATSDYIDTTTDKYRLISTAPGFRASSVPGRDIGAMQHAEPTLPTAANVYTGTGTYGYADALITPTKVVSSIANATAGNIKSGVTIGDVTGTFAGATGIIGGGT